MKKKLFVQEIYLVLAAVVITVLMVASLSSIFTAVYDIPVKGGRLSTDCAVISEDKVLYATRELSAGDMQKLLMSLKDSNVPLLLNGIEYSVSAKEMADGAKMVTLTPHNTSMGMILIITVIAIFLLVYVALSGFVSRRRSIEIIKPILALKEQTHKMVDGEFLVNIEDSGAEEVRELANEIENLRLRLKNEIYINKKSADNRKMLISGMSHDLRTPITALKGYLEGLSDGIADTPEKRKEYINKALTKTELINSMIADLLLYSKLDMNQVEFKMQMINASDYLKTFCDEYAVLFERSEKRLILDLSEDIDYNIYVDTTQLDRVMANIAENALHYTVSGAGMVVVSMRSTSGSVIIEVHDNGIGIPKSELNNIFDSFYRGEKSRESKGSSGLGLAISKQIIENMGGRIWASSELGEGTSIIISLKKYEKGKSYEKDSYN